MENLPPTPSERRGGCKDKWAIETIYLGGGTPSQLTGGQLEQIFSRIDDVYGLAHAKEVTIECNPDDITEEYAEQLGRLPVNRVSMGVQTFSNERLRFLHRRHTAEQIPMAIERLRKAGIRNISIDLMYGFPEETLDDWQRDIEEALRLDVEHLSAYCLSIEENTPLWKLTMENPELRTDEELQRQMFEVLIDQLTAAGYEHYEISNFARPDFRSRHNSSYWNQTPYIGLGAAAHGYNGTDCRRWNVDDIKAYIEGIENGTPVFEQETLDADTRYNERVMTALRTCEGLDLRQLSEGHKEYCLQQARRFVVDGLLQAVDDHLRLTRKGLFVSNMVMSELMKID
jgi:oxygen-independent coproporphyrinogen-3 oxidase